MSNTTRCALCTCFADYVYGKWAGFSCDTCNLGYGKSQVEQYVQILMVITEQPCVGDLVHACLVAKSI